MLAYDFWPREALPRSLSQRAKPVELPDPDRIRSVYLLLERGTKQSSLRWEHMRPRVLRESCSDRSRPRIRELPLMFVLVLKPEGFMTASSLLDSRCNHFLSPTLITDNTSGGAHRFIALANHLDIRP